MGMQGQVDRVAISCHPSSPRKKDDMFCLVRAPVNPSRSASNWIGKHTSPTRKKQADLPRSRCNRLVDMHKVCANWGISSCGRETKTSNQPALNRPTVRSTIVVHRQQRDVRTSLPPTHTPHDRHFPLLASSRIPTHRKTPQLPIKYHALSALPHHQTKCTTNTPPPHHHAISRWQQQQRLGQTSAGLNPTFGGFVVVVQ
jgi:hypothetical protein